MRSRYIPALLLLSLAAAVPADAQPVEPLPDRPRIGLVLGGGGARGAAHIGVLRELERQRIPVDAIVGTSMGAVVGALYAAGDSPDDLESLVNSIDWADAFVDTPRRQDLTFRRKEDDAAYPAKLELGLSDGELLVPRGLIQGQKLQRILREELLHVSHIENFDELPTPFRAVAADIESGDAVVMQGGDLALAARASMSAPGIFAPVVVDDRTLVDGGLVANVPVEAMREMGVDVIIAIDVEFPLYPPEGLQSALAITEQMLTILIRKETLRQLSGLSDRDVLIRPELGEYASTNFNDISEAIDPGEVATLDAASSLARLALDEAAYARYQASRQGPVVPETSIAFVRVVDDGPLSPNVVASVLRTKAGDPVDPVAIADDLDRLYALNYYEHVNYRIVTEDGETGVVFETISKSWGPNFLKFGLSLEEDFEGSTAFNVAARLTATGLNALGAEWRNDLQLGSNPRFESEFYQSFGFDARYFVAPRVGFEQDNFRAFAGPDAVATFRVSETEAGLDVGRTFGHWGELRLGVLRGNGTARVIVGDPQIPNSDFDIGGLLARFRVDMLDDPQFPKNGTRINLDWLQSKRSFGADNDFDIALATIDHAWSWGRNDKNTILGGLEYATTINSPGEVQDFFSLGGFLRLSGLERGAVTGPHAGLARLTFYRELGTGNAAFDMPLYFGASVEAGNAWQDRSDIDVDSLLVNGSLFAGIDTFVGQLFLGAGFSEGGERNFYLFLGNPRPLQR